MSVSVLTITKREGWEDGAIRSMESQTVQPDKWLIIQEPDIKLDVLSLVAHGAQVADAPDKKPDTRSNLNVSLNCGLSQIESDYVIFYQDFIELETDCIEELVASAEQTDGFVTTATIEDDGKHDARYTGMDGLRECLPREWEANVAIAPMEAVRELGGFDEEYDNGWSWDNVNLAERAHLLGYKFYIDESIKPRLQYHEKEKTIPPNGEFHEQRMREVRRGLRPIKLNYL